MGKLLKTGWLQGVNSAFTFVYRKREQRRSWWSLPRKTPGWFFPKTENGSSVKKDVRSALWRRLRTGWGLRILCVWRPTIYPISVGLSPLVPWWFTKRASRSAAITENSRSNGCRDLMITPAWKRCLQGVLPMNPRANTTAFPFFRIWSLWMADVAR